LSVASDIGIT